MSSWARVRGRLARRSCRGPTSAARLAASSHASPGHLRMPAAQVTRISWTLAQGTQVAGQPVSSCGRDLLGTQEGGKCFTHGSVACGARSVLARSRRTGSGTAEWRPAARHKIHSQRCIVCEASFVRGGLTCTDRLPPATGPACRLGVAPSDNRQPEANDSVRLHGPDPAAIRRWLVRCHSAPILGPAGKAAACKRQAGVYTVRMPRLRHA